MRVFVRRLGQLWHHRREVWCILRDTGAACVDSNGVVYVPTSALERRVAIMLIKIGMQAMQSQVRGDWESAALSVIRRLDVADVATRGEVMAAERQRTSAMFV